MPTVWENLSNTRAKATKPIIPRHHPALHKLQLQSWSSFGAGKGITPAFFLLLNEIFEHTPEGKGFEKKQEE